MVRWFEKHFFHNIFWEQKLFLEHKFSLDNIFLPTNFSTKIVISNKFLTNKLKKKSLEQLLIYKIVFFFKFIKRIIGFDKNKINLFQFFFMDNKQTLFENFLKNIYTHHTLGMFWVRIRKTNSYFSVSCLECTITLECTFSMPCWP